MNYCEIRKGRENMKYKCKQLTLGLQSLYEKRGNFIGFQGITIDVGTIVEKDDLSYDKIWDFVYLKGMISIPREVFESRFVKVEDE